MKYGRLIQKQIGDTVQGSVVNIGDNFQNYSVDNAYRIMGVEEKDIINVNVFEMADYEGEYVLLPIVGYGSHYKRFRQFPISNKIIPVFWGFEMSDDTCDDIVDMLKKWEPIGCRDEWTMNLLRKKGIESFLSGCLSITLPRRKECNPNKVFMVDVPESVRSRIPDSLIENVTELSHEYEINADVMTYKDVEEAELFARDVRQKYENECKLLITSRLHAAVPCLAMGIPVILVIDNIDSRFSWLDKLIPIYDSNSFSEIDWNPSPVNIEGLKKQILDAYISRLNEVFESRYRMYDISSFWECRQKVEYNRVLSNVIENVKKRVNEKKASYIIWGAGVHGKLAHQMISERIPQLEFVCVVDKYVKGKMYEKSIVEPKDVTDIDFDIAIITSHLGRFEAEKVMNSMNKEKDVDWFFFMSKDVN